MSDSDRPWGSAEPGSKFEDTLTGRRAAADAADAAEAVDWEHINALAGEVRMAHTGKQDSCPYGDIVEGPTSGEGSVPKTFCRKCADEGADVVLAMPNDASPTPKPERFVDIGNAITKYIVDFGLMAWTLTAGETWPEDNTTDDAFVWRQPSEMHAIIFVNPDQPDSQVERLVVHEMLHLAHVRLDELCSNGQPVGVIEAYDRELEAFINIMSTALTGIAWEPTGDWAERFETKNDPS